MFSFPLPYPYLIFLLKTLAILSTCSRLFCICKVVISLAGCLAITIISLANICDLCTLKFSRIALLILFLNTALPSFLETLIPKRKWSISLLLQVYTTNCLLATE